MKRYKVMVLTEPTAGKEDEFNDYYERLHLDEVLATTGWDSAQRYRFAGAAGDGCELPYLAVYEAQGESADEVLRVLKETRANRQQSDALNRRTGRVWVFEEIGPKHSAKAGG